VEQKRKAQRKAKAKTKAEAKAKAKQRQKREPAMVGERYNGKRRTKTKAKGSRAGGAHRCVQ
jgi:hypothetical protein